MPTRKLGYTCVVEALTVMDQLPLRTSEVRKREHYARPELSSFGGRAHKFSTVTVESSELLGVEGSAFVDLLVANVVDERDGGSMARNRVLKERLLQIVLVTSRHLEEGVPRQTPATGPPRDEMKQEGGG